MQPPRARSTLALFVLRFAALIALTLAVLASVSVRASREPGTDKAATDSTQHAVQPINPRQYRLSYPDAVQHR